jgi:hypothetical protein
MIFDFLKIQDIIENSTKPYLIGRIACGAEPKVIGDYLLNNKIKKNDLDDLIFNAGINIKNKEDIDIFINEYYQAIVNSDLIGVWKEGCTYHMTKQIYDAIHIKNIELEEKYYRAQALEPYYHMNDNRYRFNEIIKGKKILIISSHINTIKKQLGKNKILFKKPIFEDNTFIFVKPPITFAGNHKDIEWTFYYEQLKKDVINIGHFDLALVACGGYGMPICNFIKKDLKKNSFFVGGCLQIFFGIKGHRWNINNNVNCLYNEHWINVLEEDKPSNYKMIENGCYW